MFTFRRARSLWLSLILLGVATSLAHAVDPPYVRELRTQQVGNRTYFHVVMASPPHLVIPTLQPWSVGFPGSSLDLNRQPHLVPQDDRARMTTTRWEIPSPQPGFRAAAIPQGWRPVIGLEFVDQCVGTGKGSFLLLYPTEVALLDNKDKSDPTTRYRRWGELPIELDFDKAERLPAMAGGRRRDTSRMPGREDLEGLWASAQAASFAILEAQTPEFSFYGFAREATSRKYGVPAPSLRSSFGGVDLIFQPNRLGSDFQDNSQLYETTTGAAAIAESLQMDRLLNRNGPDRGERTRAIANIPGIEVAEHPWQKMMGDHKPTLEPLARFIPHDNYYIHFQNFRKFLEMCELSDQWGTSLLRAYEIHSRDYQLKQRYERQLCLRSTVLGKTLGPLVIRGLAVTGSDGYLREGSDITLIFHVVNRPLFLAAVNPFLTEARQTWGSQMKEGHEEYHGVSIESFTTPLREVSLYRATVDNVVIYANSPVGLRRVLDARQGRSKPLADSLDFQYMRTVFRSDDGAEDGFAFLSDAFIRQLVGPASKIKEKRRLEAITSLHMRTNDVLFTAWETGKLPVARQNEEPDTLLKVGEIATPDGKRVTWDAERKMARSDLYGTLHFATPLIELPIDKVTEIEERQYLQFREQYLGLWRQYFDPIGVRVALNNQQVRLETYILPLIQNSTYNTLRLGTGGGTIPLQIRGFSPKTIVQIMSHVSPGAPPRDSLASVLQSLSALGGQAARDWLGDWSMIRLEESEVYSQLARRLWQQETAVANKSDPLTELDLLFQVPVTVGIGIKNSLVLASVLTAVKTAVHIAAPDAVTWAPLDPPYKGVSIVRIQAKPRGPIDREINRNGRQPFLPAIYYAQIEDGWYASLREECLREIIDAAEARRAGKPSKPETVPVNTSLYLAPSAGKQTREFVNLFLEAQTHRQALASAPMWYVLYRGGLIPENATDQVREKTAMHYLGFVPVSGEGASYRYESKTDDVVNARHGSPRRPQRHPTLAANSPLAELLDQFQTLRADLRFREDGINTVLTLERSRK